MTICVAITVGYLLGYALGLILVAIFIEWDSNRPTSYTPTDWSNIPLFKDDELDV